MLSIGLTLISGRLTVRFSCLFVYFPPGLYISLLILLLYEGLGLFSVLFGIDIPSELVQSLSELVYIKGNVRY